MAQKKDISRQGCPPYSYAGSKQPAERYRPRTPAEVVDDSYSAVIQVTALNTVTHMAYDSVRTVMEHKHKLMAAYPEIEAELNALGFAHVQGLIAIQRQVTDNEKRESS